MSNIIALFVLILPWVILPYADLSDPFRLPKSTAFDIMCLVVICFALFRGIKKQYFNKYLAVFVSWVFVTIYFNWYVPYTLIVNKMQRLNTSTIEPSLHFILGTILTFICLSTLDEEDYKKIAKVLCFSAVLASIIGILQVLNLDIFGKLASYKEGNKFTAFLDHPNAISNYIALSIPLFLYFNKPIYYLGLIIVLLGVLMSHCTGALLAVILGLSTFVFIALRNIKRLSFLWSLVLLTLLSYFLFPISHLYKLLKLNTGFDGRIDIWNKALVHIKDNPIFGQGLGIFKTWDLRTNVSSALYWYNPHNDWLDIICQIGILGLVLLLLVIINSLRRFNYKVENKLGIAFLCVLFEFLFIMIGSFPLNIAPIVLTGLISFWAVETL